MASKRIWIALNIMMIAILACTLNTPKGQAAPKTEIASPTANTEFKAGDKVTVQSDSTDSKGISYVQLLVDGTVVHTDSAPSAQKEFSLSQDWVATSGSHVISVRAYNADGIVGDPATIQIQVSGAQSTDTPSAPGYVIVTSSPTTTPTNTPKPPKAIKTLKPAGLPPLDFSGHWYTNYGTLDIVQNGGDVTGTLYDAFSEDTIALTGTVSGDQLTGSLATTSDTSIKLTLGDKGITFDGQRSGGGPRSGDLCGAKPGHHFPDGCSFSGQWNYIREPVDPDCPTPLTIVRQDEEINGVYCINRIFNGTISYTNGGETIVQGTMLKSQGGGPTNDTDPFKLYLLDLNGNQFNGYWESGSYGFCGWRAGLSPPTVCASSAK